MTLTANGDVQLAGLDLTADSGYIVTAFNPWAFPDLTASDIPRSGVDGMIQGRDLRRVRRVPLDVLVIGAVEGVDRPRAVARLAALQGVARGTQVLRWVESDTTYRLEGRVRLVEPDSSWIGDGSFPVQLRFEAGDPHPWILSDEEHSASTGFPTGGVGRTYDLEFPRVYGTPGSGGSVVLSNDGTVGAPWHATITGPWVNPTIRDVLTGDQLRLSISLGPGDVLELDSTDESVFLGSAHRLNAVLPGSVWPQIRPGSSEWRIGGASGSGVVSVRWRDAWL